MEKIEDKIDSIVSKLQKVLENNKSLQKEIASMKTKLDSETTKNNDLQNKLKQLEQKLKEGNAGAEIGISDKERVHIKRKIKDYITDIDGFLDKLAV